MTNKPDKLKRFLFRIFRNNETALHELSYLFWECTWRCNLSCKHCGSDCKSESYVKDMPFEDFLNAILPLKKQNPKKRLLVVITGGEPLLRKDLAKCGKSLIANGFRWGIVTNGMLYDEKMHRSLISSGLSSITVSLDGLEETHNWLRNNEKSFRNAVNALRLISRTPFLTYDVVTCVHKKNIEELPDLKEFLISEGIKNWRIFTISPIGRAANNDDLQLNRQQIEKLFDFIAQTRLENRINITFSCEAYTGKYEESVRDSYFFCRAGINIGSILIDGSISACPNIDRKFVQGNIYKDDLCEIWENRFEIMRNREWMKNGKCLNCSDFKQCKGGAMHLRPEPDSQILRCYNFKKN